MNKFQFQKSPTMTHPKLSVAVALLLLLLVGYAQDDHDHEGTTTDTHEDEHKELKALYRGYFSAGLNEVFGHQLEGVQMDLEMELYNRSETHAHEHEEGHAMLYFLTAYEANPAVPDAGDTLLASFPLMVVPVCIGYKLPSFSYLRLNPNELGQILYGTTPLFGAASPVVFDLSGNTEGGPVWSNTLQFVIASPASSGLTQTILVGLIAAKVPGFSSFTELPAAVLSNPQIVVLESDLAVKNYLSQSSTNVVSFVDLFVASDLQLPCMATKSNTDEHNLHAPHISIAESLWYKVNHSSNSVYATPGADVYPFVGPLTITVNATASCLPYVGEFAADAFHFFFESGETSGLTKFLAHWGFAPLSGVERAQVLGDAMPLICLNEVFVSVPSGGGTSPMVPLQDMITTFMTYDSVFVDYPGGSSSFAIREMKARTIVMGDTELALNAEERTAYPHLRHAPLLAFSVSLSYNVAGHTALAVPLCELVPLLKGEISFWDDPRITSANPGLVLPHAEICILSRTGKTGTHEILTHGLQQIDTLCHGGGSYQTDVVLSPIWSDNPFLSHDSLPSVSAMAEALTTRPNCMGLTPTPTAAMFGLSTLHLINGSTHIRVEPSEAFVAQTLAAAERDPDDMIYNIKLQPGGYPFVGVSYWLYSNEYHDEDIHCEVVEEAFHFMKWTLTSDEARSIVSKHHYVTFPLETVKEAEAIMEANVRCEGNLLFPPPPTPPTPFPYWVLAIIALALVAIVGIVYWRVARYRAIMYAPRDTNAPFTILLLGPKNLSDMFHRAKAENVSNAMKTFAAVVGTACEQTGCYRVKVVNDFYVIAAKKPKNACDCAAHVQKEMERFDWETVFPPRVYHGSMSITAGESPTAKYDRRESSNITSPSNSSSGTPLREDSTPTSSYAAGRGSVALSSTPSSNSGGSLELSYGIHHGKGRIIHDAELNTYDYSGHVVEIAAMIADIAQLNQILVTKYVVDHSVGHTEGVFYEYGHKKLKGKDYELHTMSGFGLEPRSFESLQQHDGEGEEGGNILASLEQSKTGISTKRIAMLCVFFPSLIQSIKGGLTTEGICDQYRVIYPALERIVSRNRGHIWTFVDGKFYVSFNAFLPCASPATRAVTCGLDITELGNKFGDVCCGVALGTAHVGNLDKLTAKEKHHDVMLGQLTDQATFLAQACIQYQGCKLLTTSRMNENELAVNFYYEIVELMSCQPREKLGDLSASMAAEEKTEQPLKAEVDVAEPSHVDDTNGVSPSPPSLAPFHPPAERFLLSQQFPSGAGSTPSTSTTAPAEAPCRALIHVNSLRSMDNDDEWMYEMRRAVEDDRSGVTNEIFWALLKEGKDAGAEAFQRTIADDARVVQRCPTLLANVRRYIDSTDSVSAVATQRLELLGSRVAHLFCDGM